MKFDVVMKQFKLSILNVSLIGTRGMTADLLTAWKNFSVGMHSDVYTLIQTLSDGRYYCTLHFDTRLIDLDPDSRSQECGKAKSSVPIISQKYQ